jgi:nucleoside-diphosphate kinase
MHTGTPAMSDERTLVLVKPDGVQRALIGEVTARLERRGLHLVALRMLRMDRALAERHYAEHVGKPFFDGLVRFITSAPVVAMVWEGPGAVALVRAVMGATDPKNSAPGTIRGDLAVSIGANVVHGSDSPSRAVEEMALFFSPDSLVEWTSAAQEWVSG